MASEKLLNCKSDLRAPSSAELLRYDCTKVLTKKVFYYNIVAPGKNFDLKPASKLQKKNCMHPSALSAMNHYH